MGKRGDHGHIEQLREWDPASPDPLEKSPLVRSDEDVLFPELPADVLALAQTNLFVKQESERNRKHRLRATALLMLRAQGHNRRQIGQMLHMTPNAVRMALVRARKEGRLNELQNVLETDSAALAVESLNFHLKKKDKETTLETLKGLGHFRSYTNNQNNGVASGAAFPPLTVNIVNAPNQGQTIQVEPLGVPRDDAIE